MSDRLHLDILDYPSHRLVQDSQFVHLRDSLLHSARYRDPVGC